MTADQDTITVDGTDYAVGQLTDRQQVLLAHVRDLDSKISQTQFSLDQLRVGREAFLNELARELQGDTSGSAS